MVMFREIHKNTWLKRLTADGKKITIGPKKSERSWVVFCVHDDTEALLEGYPDPRHAPSHSPEWTVSMQNALHISHALIPNSHEFEFVVTLTDEVVRFHAMSWDIMQEWVETLRSKLREMKILSPRENLYTKLPEIRAPLLPTRDPTSPLPAPPPIPAAIVPGVERVIPPSIQTQTNEVEEMPSNTPRDDIESLHTNTELISANNDGIIDITTTTTTAPVTSVTMPTTITTKASTSLFTSMSNTLTQNLLNMLSDPISAYSEQINDVNSISSIENEGGEESISTTISNDIDYNLTHFMGELSFNNDNSTEVKTTESLLRNNFNINSSTNSINNNNDAKQFLAGHRFSADQIQNLENILQNGGECHIPRPQTSRSLSVGATDKSIQSGSKTGPLTQIINEIIQPGSSITNNKGNNITELEVNAIEIVESLSITPLPTTTSDTNTNITIIQVSTAAEDENIHMNDEIMATIEQKSQTPLQSQSHMPLKSTIADIFTFASDNHESMPLSSIINKNSISNNNSPVKLKQHEYKSNVQITPSNKTNAVSSRSNSRSNSCTTVQITRQSSTKQNQKVTKVHVAGNDPALNTYGKCFESTSTACVVPATLSSTLISSATASIHDTPTPKMSKKIILSDNSSCITNISVNNASNNNKKHKRRTSEEAVKSIECSNNVAATTSTEETVATTTNALKINSSVHYEKVFLSTSASAEATTAIPEVIQTENTGSPLSPSHVRITNVKKEVSNLSLAQLDNNVNNSKQIYKAIAGKSGKIDDNEKRGHNNSMICQTRLHQQQQQPTTTTTPTTTVYTRLNSPATARRRIVSPSNVHLTNNPVTEMYNGRPPFLLKRGNTEAVIISRPSRRDFPFLNKVILNKKKSNISGQHSNIASNDHQRSVHQINSNSNNNSDNIGPSSSSMPGFALANRSTNEILEQQRKRSCSTSDANNDQQRHIRINNNNELSNYCANVAMRSPPAQSSALLENSLNNTTSIAAAASGGTISTSNSAVATTTTHSSSVGKRLSLREQQIMQLRREIMHPGGVRLQLRRKDCVGSIAWVDAFGAVWVAGWKQKEYPVLYNALHIGDQLLSVAGMAINSATEANKIIRNSNTLFVEVLVRRIPMGRGYAIRRDREGQCLGLIRDGNTATIVDVIPNSLAARHGLPPKAQSFDGTGLTCWMLTEINGRPLNLFFKDNEIRDRLNSVGRDISILVQPSDLIMKLKKQLKSLRGYKDYLVQ